MNNKIMLAVFFTVMLITSCSYETLIVGKWKATGQIVDYGVIYYPPNDTIQYIWEYDGNYNKRYLIHLDTVTNTYDTTDYEINQYYISGDEIFYDASTQGHPIRELTDSTFETCVPGCFSGLRFKKIY